MRLGLFECAYNVDEQPNLVRVVSRPPIPVIDNDRFYLYYSLQILYHAFTVFWRFQFDFSELVRVYCVCV